MAMLAERPMEAPPLTVPVAVRFRASAAVWVRGPYPKAIAVYLAVRLVGVAVLAVMAAHRDQSLLGRLTAWDAQWYIKLADLGYSGITDSVDAAGQPYADAPMAFFPLYPSFMATVSGLPGVSTVAAGLIVSVLAGIAAACGLVRIGRILDPRPAVGLILVALWAGAPMAIVLSMPYTEGLFVALAAWALVGVLEQKWWLAGVCCMFSGLVRSTASVLIAVVVVAALIAVCRGGRDRWPALACAVAAPLGLLGYWVSVVARTDSFSGWQEIEWRGWQVHWDFGAEAAKYVVANLLTDDSVMQTAVTFLVLGAVALAVLTVTSRVPWPLAVYGIGVVALTIGTGGLPWEKARFLLPAFTVLIPVATGLAGRKRSTAVVVVVALTLAGAWFSAHSITNWQYSI